MNLPSLSFPPHCFTPLITQRTQTRNRQRSSTATTHEQLHQLQRFVVPVAPPPGAAALLLSQTPPTTAEHQHHLLHVINKVMSHYAEYYHVKSLAAEQDALSVFVAPWATTLERSLHWIGGWRPTTSFHLVYSETSTHFEAHIIDILRGFRTGDLGDLSPVQFRRVNELQCETVKEENAISDELSEWQDGVSQLMGSSSNLDVKTGQLTSFLKKADDLRLRTVRKVVDLLTPQKAVEFLIAASELHFGVRGWGINQDRHRGNF